MRNKAPSPPRRRFPGGGGQTPPREGHLLALILAIALIADTSLPRRAFVWVLSLLLPAAAAGRYGAALADNVSHAAIAWAVVRACRRTAGGGGAASSQSSLLRPQYRSSFGGGGGGGVGGISGGGGIGGIGGIGGVGSIGGRAALLEQLAAWCLGSLLDLDHFLRAGKLSLAAATHLPASQGQPGGGRPLGHALPVALLAALAVGTLLRSRRAGAVVAAAFLSHQLRDATRRGLWLCAPCVASGHQHQQHHLHHHSAGSTATTTGLFVGFDYSTPPLPYVLYLLLLLLLPAVLERVSAGVAGPRPAMSAAGAMGYPMATAGVPSASPPHHHHHHNHYPSPSPSSPSAWRYGDTLLPV